MKIYALLAAIFAMTCAARAAPLERDLGQGLAYFRVHALPDDLPSRESVRNRSCVLDLRYVRGDADAAAVLLAWLKFHAGQRTPVFLLANTGTSPALLAPLDSPDAVVGLVVLGAAAPRFAPDISLKVAPAVERRAYDALEKGASLDSLLVETVNKPRIDEEKLTKEHLPASAIADEGAGGGKPAAAPGKDTQAPLIDVVLQRAVQLHRALLAMKRI